MISKSHFSSSSIDESSPFSLSMYESDAIILARVKRVVSGKTFKISVSKVYKDLSKQLKPKKRLLVLRVAKC